MWRIGLFLMAAVLCGPAGCGGPNLSAENLAGCFRGLWVEFDTGSTASLRGISAVSGMTAWASGANGTVLRTVDGGQSWQDVSIPAASDLDFRMIHAFNENTAVVLSAGSPARLYRTDDGGRMWTLVYADTRPEVFFDALRFADSHFGIAFGDPIDGRLQLISTVDGGRRWTRHEPQASPRTIPGEAGYAASNSGLTIIGDLICIGLGGETESGRARIARSRDCGWTWNIETTPMAATESSGIFSITFCSPKHGVAVGGDYLHQDESGDNILVSTNGGRSWVKPAGPSPRGCRSAVAPVVEWGEEVVLAAGPSGSDLSIDYGRSWTAVADVAWHSLSITADGAWLWSSGADGRVGRLDVASPRFNVPSVPEQDFALPSEICSFHPVTCPQLPAADWQPQPSDMKGGAPLGHF